jgi:hypothetical protein
MAFCQTDHEIRTLRRAEPLAEELLEIVMRRQERASTLLTSNRPVEDWANCSVTARHRHARPTATPRSHSEMRATKMEDKKRTCRTRRNWVKRTKFRPTSAFDPTTEDT